MPDCGSLTLGDGTHQTQTNQKEPIMPKISTPYTLYVYADSPTEGMLVRTAVIKRGLTFRATLESLIQDAEKMLATYSPTTLNAKVVEMVIIDGEPYNFQKKG